MQNSIPEANRIDKNSLPVAAYLEQAITVQPIRKQGVRSDHRNFLNTDGPATCLVNL